METRARFFVFAFFSLSVLCGAPGAQETSARPPGACFESTGGPNGDFDWVVRTGEAFFFDTTSTFVVGGPNGAPTSVQHAVNGVIEVRNLVVEQGGEIRVMGPRPMRVLASGDVIVRGRINVSGFGAKDVATLNTGNTVELGGNGGPGGGRGGLGNPVTTGSSPRGGDGAALGLADAGGQGGETGFAPAALGKDARRPGAGAGGRFARDQGPGLEAQPGADGSPLGTGAVSGESPARGGAVRPGPFVDGDTRNDFFGERPLGGTGGGRLRGELARLWGGHGGGGGGNASPASGFPNPNWNFSSDEKGGGGGGGGGVLHVQALGRIVFGAAGEILSNGGRGATGENTNFLDHIGGSGGSGSGGHIVLESATHIDFTDGGLNLFAQPRDWLSARGGPRVVGPTQFVNPGAVGFSNGGAGGPGVVQLHVPDPTLPVGTNPFQSQIIVPASVVALRNPLDAIASPGAIALYLTCEPAPFPLPAHADAGARRAFRRMARGGGLDPLSETGADGALDVRRGLDLERLHLPQRP